MIVGDIQILNQVKEAFTGFVGAISGAIPDIERAVSSKDGI